MRNLVDVARRLLQTRKTVKELERVAATNTTLNTLDASRLLVFRGALQALAWALEVDLEQLSAPPLTNLPEQPSCVTLHRVELGGANGSERRLLWLTEIPAHQDPVDDGFSTEYWSCFFNDQQARQLYVALSEALDEHDDEHDDGHDEHDDGHDEHDDGHDEHETDTRTATCALPRLRLQPRQPRQPQPEPLPPDVASLSFAYTPQPPRSPNGHNGQRGA